MIQYIIVLSVMYLCLCVDIFTDTHLGLRKHHYQREPSTRVIQGNECQSRVAIMVSLQKHGRHVCGGTLIQAHWILTAAHCGSHGFKAVIAPKSLKDTGALCDYGVPHPEFDRVTLENDIQVIHLVIPQYEYENVRLPLGFHDAEGYKLCTYGTVMGWGYMNMNKFEVASTLQCSEVETIPIRQCEAQHGKELIGNICSDICVKGASNGDAGGPFMCGVVQYGIVSFGWGCETSLPVVYTSTHYYLDFIAQAVTFEIKDVTEPILIPPRPPPEIPLPPPSYSSSSSLSLNFILYFILITLNYNLVLCL